VKEPTDKLRMKLAYSALTKPKEVGGLMPSASVRDSSMASPAGHPRDPETRSQPARCLLMVRGTACCRAPRFGEIDAQRRSPRPVLLEEDPVAVLDMAAARGRHTRSGNDKARQVQRVRRGHR